MYGFEICKEVQEVVGISPWWWIGATIIGTIILASGVLIFDFKKIIGTIMCIIGALVYFSALILIPLSNSTPHQFYISPTEQSNYEQLLEDYTIVDKDGEMLIVEERRE